MGSAPDRVGQRLAVLRSLRHALAEAKTPSEVHARALDVLAEVVPFVAGLRSGARAPLGALIAGLTGNTDDDDGDFRWLAAGQIADRLALVQARAEPDADARIRLATQATGVGLWEWNLATNQIRWDEQMFRIYGLTPTSDGCVTYSVWQNAVLPDDLPRQEAILNETVRERRQGRREFRIHRGEGREVRHVQAVETVRTNSDGEAEWVVGTNLDITEQRRIDEALRSSEARLSLGVQVAGLGLAEVDYATNLVHLTSDAARLFGLGSEAMTVRRGTLFETVHADDRAALIAKLPELLGDGGVGWIGLVLRVHWKSGELRWLHVRAQAFFEEQGDVRKPSRATVAVLDVTESKHTEVQLRRLAGELSEADRRKDEFLATMSHELRSPLNPILGWARILQRDPGTPEVLAKGLATIERNALTQTRLVSDLLDVSRILSGKLRLAVGPTDLASTLLAAVDVVRAAAEAKGVRITVDCAADLGTMFADPDRLQQIAWNLLSNAVRFTPSGGAIRLVARRLEHAAHVTIEDDGAGIPSAALPYIFDRFRQVDSSTTRAQGGLGLGLAIVRYLVEAHGGTVTAHSDGPGRGATFEVLLPLRVGAAEGETTTKKRPEATPRTGPGPNELAGISVLLVDDDEDSLDLIRELLERAGVTVHAAQGAALALAHEGRVDLVISDIGMPHIDGYAFMRSVRAREAANPTRPPVPALALTAYASAHDADLAREAGYQEHLTKPIDVGTLLGAVYRWTRTPLR